MLEYLFSSSHGNFSRGSGFKVSGYAESFTEMVTESVKMGNHDELFIIKYRKNKDKKSKKNFFFSVQVL